MGKPKLDVFMGVLIVQKLNEVFQTLEQLGEPTLATQTKLLSKAIAEKAKKKE